jgi:hypothetical protein
MSEMYVSVPHVPPTVHPHFTVSKREKARIRATRTLTRLTHVASAGIVLASLLRPFSPQALGVTRLACQRARASVAGHTSAHCPHSNLRKRKRSPRTRRQCLAAIPRGCRIPRDPFPCQSEVCPRQARLLSCQVIRVSVDDCAGGVADAARLRS